MKSSCVILLLLASRLVDAAQFMNLNFESVIQPLPPPDPVTQTVPAELALPGWDVFIGPTQEDGVLYNGRYLSLAGVSVISRDDPVYGSIVISHNYSAFLGSGLTSPLPTAASAAIAQVGEVPSYARSIEVIVAGAGPFDLYLGGELIPMVQTAQGQGFRALRGDVSSHGDLVEELRISVPYTGIAPIGQAHSLVLDDIRFLSIPIPEPSLIVPVLLAGLAWTLAKRASGRSKK